MKYISDQDMKRDAMDCTSPSGVARCPVAAGSEDWGVSGQVGLDM